jgi:hypothetical protein
MWVWWEMMLVAGSVVPFILNKHGVFISKDQPVKEELPFFLDCLFLEEKAIVFKQLGISHPFTQLDIQEALNSSCHGCENPKPTRSSLVLNPKKY